MMKKRMYQNPNSPKLKRNPPVKLTGYTDTTTLIFSETAITRMRSYIIDEAVVREILKDGHVNISESELSFRPVTYSIEHVINKVTYIVSVSPQSHALRVNSVQKVGRK